MTKGLMSSSRTSVKLYHKCMKKARDHPALVKYIRYRNLYNSLKRQAKIAYYDELFQKYKYDIRCTWKTIRTVIGGHNDKTSVPQTFV